MKRAAAFLAALTLVRFLAASAIPLSPDETYYWTWSKALAAGYLDHPPMVALWIRTGTALAGDDRLGVRLLAPLSALFGSLLLAFAARDLLGLGRERAIAAAVLLNATLMVGAGAITMTPDTPLLFFWTLSLWLFGRSLATGSDGWLIAGFASIGLAFDSKYTGILLLPAILLWLLRGRGPRASLAWPIWAGGFACLSLMAPVIVWNAAHGFASFAKQGGRAGDIHLQAALRFLSELVLGQLGLATPLLAILFCAGVIQVSRRAWRGDSGATLVALATLVPAAIFVEHAVGGRVQANWPSVLYPSAAIAAACCCPPRRGCHAAASGLAITLLVYLQAALHPIALPARLDVAAVKLGGWQDLSRRIGAIADAAACPLAADNYEIASELAWHGAAARILGTDLRWSFIDLPHRTLAGCVLLVRSDRRREPPDPTKWASSVMVATLGRGPGRTVERYDLYRAQARGILATSLPVRSPALNPR